MDFMHEGEGEPPASEYAEQHIRNAELDHTAPPLREEEEPLEPYKPYHADPVEDENHPELEHSDDPNWCYLCTFGQTTADIESNDKHELLLRFMHEQYQQMSLYQFTKDVQDFYNMWLRSCVELPRYHRDFVPRVWRRATIYEHIEKHTLNVASMYEDCSRTFREVLLTVRDNGLFLVNKRTGQKSIDRKNLSIYLATFKNLVVATRHITRPSNIL